MCGLGKAADRLLKPAPSFWASTPAKNQLHLPLPAGMASVTILPPASLSRRRASH